MASAASWPEAQPLSLQPLREERSSRKGLGFRAVGAAGLALLALAVVLTALALSPSAPQPVEEVIIGADGKALKATKPSTQSLIKAAVAKAVRGAEADLKADIKDEVKSAVSQAVADAVSADKKMSGVTLVGKIVKDSTKEGKAAAKAEADQYGKEMSHIASELDSQIGSLLKDSATKAAAKAKLHSAKGAKSKQSFLKMAAAVLRKQQADSAEDDSKQARAEKVKALAAKIKEMKEYQEDEKAILSETHKLDARKGSPISSQHNVHYVAEEDRRDRLAKKYFKTLQKLHPHHPVQAKFHKSKAVKKDEALHKEEQNKIYKQVEHSIKEHNSYIQQDMNDKKKSHIPVTSKKFPAYIKEEKARDNEAQKDLKVLEKVLKAKKSKHTVTFHQAAHPPHEDRTKEAEKYLKIMEHSKDDEAKAPAHQSVDRNQLAEKYLEQLKKSATKTGKAVPVGSRKNPAYVSGEKARDAEAKKDMELLKKGQALVKRGSKVEKVDLSKTAIHGVNKLQEEKDELVSKERPEQDRNKLAQKYLHELKKDPTVGKPFHDFKVPKALLHPHKSDMEAKAQKYLKQLKAAQPPKPKMYQEISRTKIAQEDLHKLESSIGHKPKLVKHSKPITADNLAAKDLHALEKSRTQVHKAESEDSKAKK